MKQHWRRVTLPILLRLAVPDREPGTQRLPTTPSTVVARIVLWIQRSSWAGLRGETAILTGFVDVKMVNTGLFRVRTLQIYARNGGLWQMTAHQSARIAK